MPFRLISYIIVLVFLVTFIGLNLGNTSDVNLWFSEKGQFTDVPIVVSFFIMYILGALSIVPYIIGNQFKSFRKKNKEKKSEKLMVPPKKISARKKKNENNEIESDHPEE